MHDALRARLMRHIEALPEAQLYQALDYVEFLTSKYARDQLRQPNPIQRFTEVLEDKMRGQGLAFGTIKGALGMMGTAGRMVSGITEAGRAVVREVEEVLAPTEGPQRIPPQPQQQLPPPPRQQGDGDPHAGAA